MEVQVSDLGAPGRSAAFLAIDATRRVGLIVLDSDLTTEPDFARLTRDAGVSVFATRIASANPVTVASLAALGPRLTAAAAGLIPDLPLDVVYFSCTSGSAVIGDAGVAAAVRAAKPGARVINPMLAVHTALTALGARRLSILTPYTPEVGRAVAERFSALGYDVAGLACWGLTDDRDMARVRRDVLVREAVAATAPDADALFISCTAVPAAEAVAEIEAETGRPVVTSNQAAAWMALRLCGVRTDVSDGAAGRLFACPDLSDVSGESL